MTHWKPDSFKCPLESQESEFKFICDEPFNALDTTESLFIYFFLLEELPVNMKILSIRSPTHAGGIFLFMKNIFFIKYYFRFCSF